MPLFLNRQCERTLGDKFYGPSYVSPDQVTGKEEGTTLGFTQEYWTDDGSAEFNTYYSQLGPDVEGAWPRAVKPLSHSLCILLVILHTKNRSA